MGLSIHHECDGKPNSVIIVYDELDIGSWCASAYVESMRGCDERTYTELVVEFPIAYCPFCGKKLPDYSEGKIDDEEA